MLSGAKPAAVMDSRKGVFRLFEVGMERPSLSLPRLVSTTIRRVGVSSTSEWIDILSRPSSVAKCGISQGNFAISSLLASGRINLVLPVVSSSTIFVILTWPTLQRIRRPLSLGFLGRKDAGFRIGAQWIISQPWSLTRKHQVRAFTSQTYPFPPK